MLPDEGKRIYRNTASSKTFFHVLNLFYYQHLTDKRKYFYLYVKIYILILLKSQLFEGKTKNLRNFDFFNDSHINYLLKTKMVISFN